MRSIVLVLALLVSFVVPAPAATPPVIKAAPAEIQVRSADSAVSFPVYTGSGGAVRAADGPMAGVIVARDADGKTANYLRATLTAEEGRSLVRVGVRVTNAGKAPLAFRIGDLAVATPGAVLMALGEGEHPFTKDEATLERLRAATREIPAGEKLDLVYVYSIRAGDAPGRLVYKGKQGIALKDVPPAPPPAG